MNSVYDSGDLNYQRTSRQVLRHRSFTYQEFSQRYADSSLLAETIPLPELRSQDTKNRQNSIDDVDPFVKQKYEMLMQDHFKKGMELYQQMLDDGIAKECSRLCSPRRTNKNVHDGINSQLDSLY